MKSIMPGVIEFHLAQTDEADNSQIRKKIP